MMYLAVVLLAVVIICLVWKLKTCHEQLVKALRADRMHTAYLGNMSHQMRTALHSVTGLAEIISKEDVCLSKSEKRSITDQIKFNANLITSMLNEFSALSDGDYCHEVQSRSFSPNALCLRCLESCRAGHVNDAVRLSFKRQLADTYLLWSDAQLLELLLNKLLFNSCRFTQSGDIIIGCYTELGESKFVFYVQDTGVGIPKSRKGFLYSWFEEPDKIADPAELDLSIAQKLAARLNGYLQVDETYTNGTRMVLTLPLK